MISPAAIFSHRERVAVRSRRRAMPRRRGAAGLCVLVLAVGSLWSVGFTGPSHEALRRGVAQRAKKKDQTQAYNEVASLEVSEKVKNMPDYMSPEEVAADIIRAREKQLESYMNGVEIGPERSDESIAPAYALFLPAAVGLALALYYLSVTYQDFKERSVGMISYADLCGTDAFQLKQLFFPSAECVEPVWSMSKEEFEESQRQVQPTVRGEKKLPKTAQELLKEMEAK